MPLALIRIKLTVNFYKGILTGKTILGVPKSMNPAAEVTVYKEYLFIYLMMNPQWKYKQKNP